MALSAAWKATISPLPGEQDEKWNRVIIEDNGAGLNEAGLARLLEQLHSPMSDDIGCGTWNVHHRLFYQFGEGSGLTFIPVKRGLEGCVNLEAQCADEPSRG